MPNIEPHKSNGHAASNGKPLSIMSEALRLHDRGLWVVPCDGKRATVKEWDKKRLTRKELREKLTGTRLNIAFVLSQSDMIDVECDTPDAETNLKKLFDGKIPRTPTWRSKRGLHRLFKRPTGLPEKAVIEMEGIEFRIGNGKGALSIVPPSKHPDGPRYEWLQRLSIHEIEPAELLLEIVKRLRDSASLARTAPTSAGDGDVPEGKRNDELFKLACRLRDTGIGEESVAQAVLTENAAHCKPPLDENEVRDIVRSAMKRGAKGSQTNAETLLDIATNDSELWHTPDGTAYATVQRDGHREHWSIRSRAFKQWLGKAYYDRTRNAVGSQTLQDVINALEGKARFDGQEHQLFVRVAEYESRIYIDLADDAWRAVEIDRDGWRIVDDSPVRFRRAKGMLPLPLPERGGSVVELRRFVNVSDGDWPLLISCLVAALRPVGPYPILTIIGEQGSAKTTTARVYRGLVDPNTAPVRSSPRSEHDLMIAASNGWMVSLDNLSYVTPELSDGLCRLATGGGFATRTLYENDEETFFAAQRPSILNGIEDIGTRSDLLDRALIVDLPRIEPKHRRAEKFFWLEFEEARPRASVH